MKIRMLKDGSGYSECNAPDDKVGFGRCNHVLGGDVQEIRRIERGFYSTDVQEVKDIAVKKEEIAKYLDGLPSIPPEKEKSIVSQLMSL